MDFHDQPVGTGRDTCTGDGECCSGLKCQDPQAYYGGSCVQVTCQNLGSACGVCPGKHDDAAPAAERVADCPDAATAEPPVAGVLGPGADPAAVPATVVVVTFAPALEPPEDRTPLAADPR